MVPPKVDTDLLHALGEIVEKSPPDFGCFRSTWTRELLARVLLEETGVQVSIRTLGRMLSTLKVRWGMPRPTVQCPWSEAKKKTEIKKIKELLRNLPQDEVAYYEDELDIHLNPKIGRDWTPRGVQRQVLTPGKNAKNYTTGALKADGSSLVWVTAEKKNSQLFISLLKALLKANPNAKRIHIILDNFAIHSSRSVQEFIKSLEGRGVLHFLPPYSPEENKIERLWREVHANVTRNHKCKTITELIRQVNHHLRSENRKRKRSHPTQAA